MTCHVALYIPALQLGGAERVTVNIANGLAEQEYDVDLVLAYDRGRFRDEVDDHVTTTVLDTPSVPVLGIGGTLLGLRDYIERTDPDVVVSAMTHANVVAILAARLSDQNPAVVPTEHNEFGKAKTVKDRIVYNLARQLYSSATQLIAVSEGVARSVTDNTPLDSGNVTVLNNPIEVDEIRNRATEPLDDPWIASEGLQVIFTVGRLTPQKDIPMLLEAFDIVHERRSDTRLIVAGKGPRRSRLVSLAEQHGIGDVVSFPGYVDNPYAYMHRADVFALSSRHEGLPTVLVEALACGCPVVATDCPSGPREILADGEYGPIVPVGNSGAFAEAIISMLAEAPDPDRLRERSDNFAMGVVLDQYTEFLEHIAPDNAESPMDVPSHSS